MKKIISFLFFHFITVTIFACSCAGKPAVKASVESSAIVVSAVVLSQTITTDLNSVSTIEGDTNNLTGIYEWPYRIVKLKINTVYKGQVSSDTLVIITATSGASCGVEFETGKQYIIYGKEQYIVNDKPLFKRKPINNNVYWTSLCSRTCRWNKEEEFAIKKLISKK